MNRSRKSHENESLKRRLNSQLDQDPPENLNSGSTNNKDPKEKDGE
jgi:hypothetical protein